MKTIGFTTVYYTLWEVGEPYEEPVYYNGLKIGVNVKQNVSYIQNLSMDLESAKEHEKIVGEEYNIDLTLCGHSSFTRTLSSDIKDRENYYPHDCFSFGKMEGQNFSKSDDVWQLDRAYNEERSARRRACARRRLIELGEIVRYDWEEKKMDTKKDEHGNKIFENDDFVFVEVGVIKHKYATVARKKFVEDQKRVAANSGHFFKDGERIELEIMLTKSFSFEGHFGRTYVDSYVTRDGKILKYMGSSPADISEEEFTKVMATISHDNYKGQDETKLKRIKISNKDKNKLVLF
jgi:hypothetical protein